MGQADNEKVKGQNLARMNLIVSRIEVELDQLKNLINLQIDGLTTTNISTNCDGDSDLDGNCDTSISIIDTLKIENDTIDTTAEDVDKVSNFNSNYQYEFNNEDQGVDCQNRPSNEDEMILGGVDFNCEMPSKEVDETHVDPPQSSSYDFSSFQNQGVRYDESSPLILSSNCEVDRKSKISYNNLPAVKTLSVDTGERPFKCKICSKSFTRKEHLKRHYLVHTGEKPHSCSICSKTFAHIQHRDRHMRTHTGEKPYSCTICSKKFAQITSRDAHITTHTGERPFSCPVCSKTFTHPSNLSHHKKKHNNDGI